MKLENSATDFDVFLFVFGYSEISSDEFGALQGYGPHPGDVSQCRQHPGMTDLFYSIS